MDHDRIAKIIKTSMAIIFVSCIIYLYQEYIYVRSPKIDYNISATCTNLYSLRGFLENRKRMDGAYPSANHIFFGEEKYYLLPVNVMKKDIGFSEDYMHEVYYSEKTTSSTTFQYFSNGNWYCIIGAGPDEKISQDNISWLVKNKGEGDLNAIAEHLLSYAYDPTNGLISAGDIILSSDNIGVNIRYLSKKDRQRIYK